jgi:hypothetical protein
MWTVISSLLAGVVQPIVSIFTKKEDTKVAEGRDDASVIQSRTTLLGQIHRDPAVAVGWYMFIVPTGVWFSAIVVYCILHPWYPWWAKVLALPENIQYIPYAVVTFLFGLAWRGKL